MPTYITHRDKEWIEMLEGMKQEYAEMCKKNDHDFFEGNECPWNFARNILDQAIANKPK